MCVCARMGMGKSGVIGLMAGWVGQRDLFGSCTRGS